MTRLRRRDVLAAGAALPVVMVAGPVATASAKKPDRGPLPVPSMALGPKATLNGDELTFTVLLTGASGLSAFSFTDLAIDGRTGPTTFTPSLVTVSGSQQFTVTASPASAKGNVNLVLLATYDAGGGDDRLVESASTPVTIVAAQGFRRSAQPRPR